MASPLRGVVPATFALAEAMAARLSPEHVREVREVSGLDPAAALALSLWSSVEAYAYVPPGSAAAVFMMGVEGRNALGGSALVWMLGTTETARHPVAVLRAARRGVRRAFAATGADCLEQYIPEWYRTGLRFVERLGFSVDRRPYRAWSGAVLRRVFVFRENVPESFSGKTSPNRFPFPERRRRGFRNQCARHGEHRAGRLSEL